MAWLLIASLAYFLLATEKVLDKFLLASKRVSHPSIFAFYSGFFGLFALVFSPWGFHLVGPMQMTHAFASGIIFCYGMLLFFFAIERSEASRVAPVLDAVITITTYFVAIFILQERLDVKEMLGVFLLIIGGIWISYNYSKIKKEIFIPGFSFAVFAGIMLALATTYFKYLYRTDNFLNIYIWTRLGVLLGAFSFFLVPSWRKKILRSLLHFRKPAEKEKGKSGFIFVLAKSLGGLGNILKEKSVSLPLASVTIVNALASVEFVFIFVIGIFVSILLPKIYEEKRDARSVFQKSTAIIIIALGIFLVAKYH